MTSKPHPDGTGETAGAKFAAGRNIALKLPADHYAETLSFYRDVLGFPVEIRDPMTAIVTFGPIRLWLDQVPGLGQPELWLEIETDDVKAASRRLAAAGIDRADAIEPLPEKLDGFWVRSPAGMVHLIAAIGG